MIEALTLAHLMARSLLEMPHYVIQVNNAAYLHRYHRFVEYAKNVYQHEGAAIIEELFVTSERVLYAPSDIYVLIVVIGMFISNDCICLL